MDASVAWSAAGAIGAFAAAGVAAWAASQSRSASRQANAAAILLSSLELDRRQAELTPRFRVDIAPWGAGAPQLRMRITLLGPPALGELSRVTMSIRDDHFRRGEGTLTAGGPTKEQIKAHIWGPYRFTPGTGPDESRADPAGRVTDYPDTLPVGETLTYQLEQTMPGSWMSMTQQEWLGWIGMTIRFTIVAYNIAYKGWTLPGEIEVAAAGFGSTQETVYLP